MEATLRRERTIIAGCLAALVVLAWLYLLDMSADMSTMAMPVIRQWGSVDLVFLFFMWAIMMIGMMVPSAAPMILAFLSLNQRRRSDARPVVPTYVFVLGYITVWSVYSLAATGAQWGLHEAAFISPSMVSNNHYLSASLLIIAGIYQWSSLKRACLASCRSPLSFLMSEWREGVRGAYVMGLRHGSYCVGCCWILMALLFIVGVMNLYWVAAITAFVIAEKLMPRGALFGRITGVGLAATGLVMLVVN